MSRDIDDAEMEADYYYLRSRIEALADEMRADIARYLSTRGARITGETLAHYADALDALIGGDADD